MKKFSLIWRKTLLRLSSVYCYNFVKFSIYYVSIRFQTYTRVAAYLMVIFRISIFLLASIDIQEEDRDTTNSTQEKSRKTHQTHAKTTNTVQNKPKNYWEKAERLTWTIWCLAPWLRTRLPMPWMMVWNSRPKADLPW